MMITNIQHNNHNNNDPTHLSYVTTTIIMTPYILNQFPLRYVSNTCDIEPAVLDLHAATWVRAHVHVCVYAEALPYATIVSTACNTHTAPQPKPSFIVFCQGVSKWGGGGDNNGDYAPGAPGEGKKEDTYGVRTDARRFETWERNLAGELGLGAAIDYAMDIGLENIERRVNELASRLRAELVELGVTVTDAGQTKCGIVTWHAQNDRFSIPSQDFKKFLSEAKPKRISVTVTGPESTLLDANARTLPPLVRTSVHYYNNEAEIQELLRNVRGVLDSTWAEVERR